MKLLLPALTFLSLSASVAAFSQIVKPPKAGMASSVDKTMEGIDDSPSVYDPTGGSEPPLTKNNKGEVWNQQVSPSLY